MGGVVKSIGSIFKKTGLDKVASIAAPFIPGAGGLIAGAIGSLGAASEAQDRADSTAGDLRDIAESRMSREEQFNEQVLPALLAEAGINPKTGQYDPTYNPNQQLADQLFALSDAGGGVGQRGRSPASLTPSGVETISERADRFYDPSQLDSYRIANREAGADAYRDAESKAQSDAVRYGFGEGPSSGLNTAILTIRRAQAGQNAAFDRDLLAGNQLRKTDYIQGQEAQRNQLLTNGLGARTNNLTNLSSLMGNSAQGAIGTLGGLQGMYADQSKLTTDALAASLGQLVKNGDLKGLNLGNIFKRKQSQSPGTTNAQVSSRPVDRKESWSY